MLRRNLGGVKLHGLGIGAVVILAPGCHDDGIPRQAVSRQIIGVGHLYHAADGFRVGLHASGQRKGGDEGCARHLPIACMTA